MRITLSKQNIDTFLKGNKVRFFSKEQIRLLSKKISKKSVDPFEVLIKEKLFEGERNSIFTFIAWKPHQNLTLIGLGEEKKIIHSYLKHAAGACVG
ncbi:hypothetical protein BVX93_02285, partial [bacterium B13(2017)]